MNAPQPVWGPSTASEWTLPVHRPGPRVYFDGVAGIGTEITCGGQRGVIDSMTPYDLGAECVRWNFTLDDGTSSGFSYWLPPGSHVCVMPDSGDEFHCTTCATSWRRGRDGDQEVWRPDFDG